MEYWLYICRGNNVKALCVCGGLVSLIVGIALRLNRITAVDFSTSAAITQNTCYAQCFLLVNFKLKYKWKK